MLVDVLPLWIADYLAAWLFLVLTIALMAGFPVTFTMMGVSFLFGLIGLNPSFFDLLPLRMWGVMTNTMLMAVPLFIFMGLALERSGLAKELLETMKELFRNVRGGLAISVVMKRSGFYNQAYFNKLFIAQLGMTPNSYRKLNSKH